MALSLSNDSLFVSGLFSILSLPFRANGAPKCALFIFAQKNAQQHPLLFTLLAPCLSHETGSESSSSSALANSTLIPS